MESRVEMQKYIISIFKKKRIAADVLIVYCMLLQSRI
jgi:hypothetical protein